MFDEFFIRNIEYNLLFERFLVSAVAAILAVRSFLKLTDYPIVGGHGLHVAHLLWGGTFMTIALMLYMFFISTRLSRVTPIIAGIGFGLFIDEIGKFVTADNNYFYTPSFAIIYAFFVVLFIISEIVGRKRFSKKEYLINSLQLLQEVIDEDFDSNEKKKATLYLRRAGNDELAAIVSKAFAKAETVPAKQTVLTQFRDVVEKWYTKIVNKKWFTTALVIFFFVDAAVSFFLTLAVTFGIGLPLVELFFPKTIIHTGHNIVLNVLQLESSLISAALILLGIFEIRSRLIAFTYFRWAVLISLFITQVFAFYEFQLGALIGFAFNVLLLSTLNYLILKQRNREG